VELWIAVSSKLETRSTGICRVSGFTRLWYLSMVREEDSRPVHPGTPNYFQCFSDFTNAQIQTQLGVDSGVQENTDLVVYTTCCGPRVHRSNQYRIVPQILW
jgi:hypothetical protein